jgi:hypothetical protein
LFPHYKIEINAQGKLLSRPGRRVTLSVEVNLPRVALLVDKLGPAIFVSVPDFFAVCEILHLLKERKPEAAAKTEALIFGSN